MERKTFEELVKEGYLLLPDHIRTRIRNVALLVEDKPSKDQLAEEGLGESETLLGLYQGVPATVRGDSYGVGPTLPDTITLFQLPIEEAAGNEPAGIRKVVAETIWHEYAHYFGMDENEVRAREEKRDSGDDIRR